MEDFLSASCRKRMLKFCLMSFFGCTACESYDLENLQCQSDDSSRDAVPMANIGQHQN